MPVEVCEIKDPLEASFIGSEIIVKDLVGDKDHYEVTIAAKEFSGKTRIQQHQMVMEALGGIVGTKLHALSIKTRIKE